MAQLVEALLYKTEGRGFDSHCSYNPFGCALALGSKELLSEMSIRNISWRVRWSVGRADNLTTFLCRLS